MYIKTVINIGPASETKEVIAQMFDAGMDIARINFSHATEEEAVSRNEIIRALNQEKGKNVRILQDLCGRRIRIGEIPGGSQDIKEGEEVTFYTVGAPDIQPGEIAINDQFLHQDLKPGIVILIESGKYRATVKAVDVERQRITAVFDTSGTIVQKKGVNVPYAKLTTPVLTDKDKKDIELGKRLKFEFVALSFVQTAADIHEARKYLNPDQKIIAKVEDPIGVQNIDEIIQATDGVMVARGDLGVELPLEEIPFIQKELIAKCRYAGKPSIVATQMLLSMVTQPRPTRAEVSDVANAVLDGADALMLSDETSIGDYPVECVATLVRIAERAETFLYERKNPFGK